MSKRSSSGRRRTRSRHAQGAAAASVPETLEVRCMMAAILYSENFDNLNFGPPVEETTPGDHVWTNVPPAGWVKDDTGVPGYNNDKTNNGMTEWIGWTFPQKDWWVTSSADQNRSQFKRASGGVMVADDDEWDDDTHPGGFNNPDELYNAKITSPSISLAGATPGTVNVEFDSSWRPEGFDDGANINNQTALVTAIYDTGGSETILHWDSDGPTAGRPVGPFYHPDTSTNEHVVLPLNVPAGATSVKLVFQLGQAANDWFWAVDNLAVTATLDIHGVRLIGASGNEGTGAAAANNEKLFDITYTTGATPSATATQLLSLPTVPDADVIGFDPENNLLYHASGGSSTSDTPTDPHYRDNHFFESIDVASGSNAKTPIFNANAPQFGSPAPFPTFVEPTTRRTDAQTDNSFGDAAKGPNEYHLAKDITWSSADHAFIVSADDGFYKLTPDGHSTYIGDPGIPGLGGPAGMTFFNVEGKRVLLLTEDQGSDLLKIDPATGQITGGDAVTLTDADGNPLAGVLSLVESPDGNTLLGLARDPAAPNDPLKRNLISIDPVTGVTTKLGTFNVPIDDLAFVYPQQVAAARVTEVYVRGTAWAQAFKDYLGANGQGDSTYGFRVDNLPADTTLPWINANEVVLRYNVAPTGSGIPTAGGITLDGQLSDYTVTNVQQIDPKTYALTLDRALGNQPPPATDPSQGDRVKLTVPGGNAGGNFVLNLNPLQGDVDRAATRRVNAIDLGFVKARANRSTSDPGTTGATYTAFADINGSGRIDAIDLGAVKARNNDSLPPATAVASSPFSASRIADEVLG